MARLFALIHTRGPSWDDTKPMEQQPAWRAHADFMNGLQAEGFIVMGGPLEGTRDVLLIFRARDEAEIRSRLDADPWHRNSLLRVTQISPWTLRLGSLA